VEKGTEQRTRVSGSDLENLEVFYWEQDFWLGYRRGLNRLQQGEIFGSDEDHRARLDMPETLQEGLSIHRVAEGVGYCAGYAGLDVLEATEKIRDFMKTLQEKYGSKAK
jgi:hypothetical protein